MHSKAVTRSKWNKDLEPAVDSTKALEYLLLVSFLIGTNPPSAGEYFHLRILYFVYSAIINMFCAVYFSGTLLVKNLFFTNSFEVLVANLSLNFSIAMSVVKQLIAISQRHRLREANEFLKLLDERSNRHSQDRKSIFKAVRYSRLFILCLPVYVFCGCGFAYNGWTNHELIYNAWYPNIFARPEDNFLAAFISQIIGQLFIGFQSAYNDTSPLCYIRLMIGHLESLAFRISRAGWDNKLSIEENTEELNRCITDHKNLLSYFDCIRPLISHILFLEFLIAGLTFCLTAIHLTFFSPDLNHQFFTLLYLLILLIQVLPCCWHVNLLMEKSDYLTTAMYSCNWMDQDNKFRKMLIIFMQRSQRRSIILAGNLAPVTLQTFLGILRFSFSMFTLLSKR